MDGGQATPYNKTRASKTARGLNRFCFRAGSYDAAIIIVRRV